jgi:hypothetical protein
MAFDNTNEFPTVEGMRKIAEKAGEFADLWMRAVRDDK